VSCAVPGALAPIRPAIIMRAETIADETFMMPLPMFKQNPGWPRRSFEPNSFVYK
jgi:hypothetical protein